LPIFNGNAVILPYTGADRGIHPSVCSITAFHLLSRKECHGVYLEANDLGSLSGIMMMFIRKSNILIPSCDQ